MGQSANEERNLNICRVLTGDLEEIGDSKAQLEAADCPNDGPEIRHAQLKATEAAATLAELVFMSLFAAQMAPDAKKEKVQACIGRMSTQSKSLGHSVRDLVAKPILDKAYEVLLQ